MDARKYYNAIARGYDELYGEEQIKKLEFALNKGLSFSGKKVIDVGCGTGIITEKIVSLGAVEVVGLDISEKMIEIARKRVPSAKFIVSDALNIPYPDCHFDLCVSFTVMQDIPKERWKDFVNECVRVSKEAWISVLKRNKDMKEIFEIVGRRPEKFWEEEKDILMVFKNFC